MKALRPLATGSLILAASSAFSAPAASTDPLVAVDMTRATIISDIVSGFENELGGSAGHEARAAVLRSRLSGLRADHLLAASLASSFKGLNAIIDEASERDSPR